LCVSATSAVAAALNKYVIDAGMDEWVVLWYAAWGIFTVLLDRLGVAPAELVYADDNPDRLAGARELGIIAFVFEDFTQYITELEKLGVSI
jgi:hypothetical protein